MIRSIVSALVLCSMLAAGPVQAQNRDRSAAPGPAVSGSGADRARSCSGTVRGKRWFLTTSQPVTTAVIHVRANGRVRRQAEPGTKANSEAFGFKNVRGGRLTDNAPIHDPDQPNRCYVLGQIDIAGGHSIQIWNAFIPRRGPISGNCTIDGLFETLCTLARY